MTNILLDITNRCNRKCIYCGRRDEYIQHYGAYEPSTMDINDIKKIVSDVQRFTSDSFVYSPLNSVDFTGGEPLIDEDTANLVLEAAKYCKEVHNLRTALYTNGDAFRSNPEKFDTLYEYLNVIQIGVHDYSDTGLDDLFNIVKHKAESKGNNNKELLIHFIVNEETKKQRSKIKDEINKIGIYETIKSNISFTFHDMIPLGRSDDMIPLILPKGSTVMGELDKYYEDIFSNLKVGKNIGVITKNGKVPVPSTCNIIDNYLLIDVYGNLRFCECLYGPVFGSIKDGNIEDALTKREEWYGIFKLYDPYGAPAKLARRIGNIDPDECYRDYCGLTLSRLFREYKTADLLVKDIEEKIMSKINPLEELPEEHSEYDLTLFQKRVLQEVLSEEPIDLLDKTGMTYKLSEALPEGLTKKVRIGALRDVVDNSPEKVTEELLQGKVMDLLYDANLPDLKKEIGELLNENANRRAHVVTTNK